MTPSLRQLLVILPNYGRVFETVITLPAEEREPFLVKHTIVVKLSQPILRVSTHGNRVAALTVSCDCTRVCPLTIWMITS